MATFINLNESKLMDYYEKMMDEVVLQYHTFPSDIPAWARCGHAEGLEQAMYESEALAHLAALGDTGKPSKRIKHHYDPKYCNGLRRRGR